MGECACDTSYSEPVGIDSHFYPRNDKRKRTFPPSVCSFRLQIVRRISILRDSGGEARGKNIGQFENSVSRARAVEGCHVST